MPKSKVRKKTDYTVNPASRTPVKVKSGPSSSIYVGVMAALALIGLVWLAVYYLGAVSSGLGEVGQPLHWMNVLGAWNFLIGFGFFVVALLMTMWWK